MAQRPRLMTTEAVLEELELEDDFDDMDELMMPGSDDEFSDCDLSSVPISNFTSPVGPTTPVPDSPSKVFELMFTPSLMDTIVQQTNLGFCILMGINRLPALDDYWSSDHTLRYSPIADRISRDRFREISRYLHFADNSTLVPKGSPGYDRLGKVRPVIDHLSKQFADIYEPHKEVAVDEAMIKFTGRSFKFTLERRAVQKSSLGRELSKTSLDFSKARTITSFLTISSRVSSFFRISSTTASFLVVRLEKIARDFHLSVQKGKLSASAWMDRKTVMMMFTNCQPNGDGHVLRRQQDGSRIPVPCPESIISYNKYMGGVDRGDQLRGYYSCRTKSRKFYKYIFYFLLDVAITNAFVLTKHHTSSSKFADTKSFRIQLAKELIGDYSSRRRRGRGGAIIRSLPYRHFPIRKDDEQTANRHQRRKCALHSASKVRAETTWFCRECGVWLCHSGDPASDCFFVRSADIFYLDYIASILLPLYVTE